MFNKQHFTNYFTFPLHIQNYYRTLHRFFIVLLLVWEPPRNKGFFLFAFSF